MKCIISEFSLTKILRQGFRVVCMHILSNMYQVKHRVSLPFLADNVIGLLKSKQITTYSFKALKKSSFELTNSASA